jgi:lipid-binding SYLF domain-containing protein
MSMKTITLLLSTALLVAGLSACSNMSKTKDSGAASADAKKAAAADSSLTESQKEAKRQSLQKMAGDTLKEIYAMDPKSKDKVEKAYAYAVFDDYIYNAVLYVAGQGSGVAFVNNSTKVPEYMLMFRAGTGPGVGYTKFRQLLIFKNKSTYEEMTTVGFDVEASVNATMKLGDFGGSQLYAGSFNPYLDVYTITDAGIDLQANWGGVEYVKNWGLDTDTRANEKSYDK